MSKGEPKSAFDLAMEKLRKQDAARGDSPRAPLSAAKKAEIAEIRSLYGAKLAEREILHRDERKKAGGDPDAIAEAERNYLADRRRLESERDAKIGKVRGSS